jgi:hypothetical protein
MPVCPIAPIQARPQVTLTEWAVFEVPRNGTEKPWTRHLAGWSCEDRHGQVSSAVQSFDPATGKCVTRSGRVYQLRGRPGLCGDGRYVWQVWMARDSLTQCRDVTSEVVQALRGPTSPLEDAPGASS